MSDNFEDFSDAALIYNRVCRVAYTLDGLQPVISTHIGDQPLYYIDDPDIEIEEEDFFDPADLSFLTCDAPLFADDGNDLDMLMCDDMDMMDSLAAFSENAESLSPDFAPAGKDEQARLEDIKNILCESRLAAAYLNVAEKDGVDFIASRQVEKAFYDRKNRVIILNPDIAADDQALLLSRELRRHWQHHQGVLHNPLTFQPDDAVLLNRMLEADVTGAVIRIAWELQLAGIKDMWERIAHSSMADLAHAFAREAFMDFRTLNNGTANAAVFEAWFLSERCRTQDKTIIQAMLADYKGYIFNNAGCARRVTGEIIAALGTMPYGKNYLSIHAPVIMEDPIFSEVRDRSNANFLWFIKFECSLKETEQYLQTDSDLSTHDIRHDPSRTRQDHSYEPENTADIIQLFEHGNEDAFLFSRHEPVASKNRPSADIIDLGFWSGRW